LSVLGKDNKLREVPVPVSLVKELEGKLHDRAGHTPGCDEALRHQAVTCAPGRGVGNRRFCHRRLGRRLCTTAWQARDLSNAESRRSSDRGLRQSGPLSTRPIATAALTASAAAVVDRELMNVRDRSTS